MIILYHIGEIMSKEQNQSELREQILTIVYAHVDMPTPEHETEANIAIYELTQLVQASNDKLIETLLDGIATVPFLEGKDNWWIDKDSVEQILLGHKGGKK
jgi:hypothetical protein